MFSLTYYALLQMYLDKKKKCYFSTFSYQALLAGCISKITVVLFLVFDQAEEVMNLVGIDEQK